MSSDTVSRDEYSEYSADSENSDGFQSCSEEMKLSNSSETNLSEMNPSEMNTSDMNLSKMKPSKKNSSKTETVESLTKLLDNPSLTSAQRQHLCEKIAWKRGANELHRRRNELAVLGQLR